MKRLILLLNLLLAPMALADYDSALSAWEARNYAEAFQEFQQLARGGDPYAMYMLGRLYAQGLGTAQDYAQAHKWFNLAAGRDHRHASAARQSLAERMTPGQIAEAQRLARNWQPGADTPAQPTPAPREQLSRAQVAQLQQALNTLGYTAGPVDGLMGASTRSAIRDYQRDKGLAVTGEASMALLERLDQDRQAYEERYGQPEPAAVPEPSWDTVVVDGFADGNFTRDPAWEVTAGDFRVEQGALLTRVLPRQSDQPQPREMRPEDLPLAILGTILNQAGGGAQGQGAQGQATGQQQPPSFAEIHLTQSLPEAFELEMQLSVEQGGRLAVGPYRSGGPSSGYRLVYTQGGARSLELVRLEGRGGQVLGAYSRPLDLADGRQHTLTLARGTDGTLTVAVDGEQLISASADGPDQGFAGLSLVNQGGAYAIDRVQLRAPR
ncbi:MAG: SEL1-like repeat protein [Candidatus Competibacteraceae bacterium]|nr:SEL1-like repeat protein [Candidatus Competibacteraceae bacterium]